MLYIYPHIVHIKLCVSLEFHVYFSAATSIPLGPASHVVSVEPIILWCLKPRELRCSTFVFLHWDA